MKKKRKINKIISLVLALGIMVGQIPLNSGIVAEATNTALPQITNTVEGLTIREGAFGDTHLMTKDEYENTLNLDFELPFKGYEIGLPIMPGIDERYFTSTDYRMDSYYESSRPFYSNGNVYTNLGEVYRITQHANPELLNFILLDELTPYGHTKPEENNKVWEYLVEGDDFGQIRTRITATVASNYKGGHPFRGYSILAGENGLVTVPGQGEHNLVLKAEQDNSFSFIIVNQSWEPNKALSGVDVAYFDDTAPEIVNIENRNNYLFIEFNETLRFSSEEYFEQFKDTYRATVTFADDSTATAELVGIESDDKTIVMLIDMNDKYHENENATLKEINFGYDDSSVVGNYYHNYYALDTKGEFVEDQTYSGLTKLSSGKMNSIGLSTDAYYPFSDYTGNLTKSYVVTEHNINLINTSPVVSDIEIETSMSNTENEKLPDEWAPDISREDLFAGVGDTITLTAEVRGQDDTPRLMELAPAGSANLTGLAMKLNVKDVAGNNIYLPVQSVSNTVQQANHESTGLLVFETLTIQEGMYIDNDDYVRALELVVQSVDGSTGVYDIYGNPITSHDVQIIVPQQKAFVDADAPTIDLNVTGTGNERDLILTVSDGVSGDLVSGLQEQVATVSLYGNAYNDDVKQNIEYEYSIDGGANFVAATLAENGESSTSITINMVDLLSNTNTIKIRLPDETLISNLALADINAKVVVTDVASNTKVYSEELIEIDIDRADPKLTLKSVNTAYNPDNAIITTTLEVWDTSQITSATYQFSDESSVTGVNVIDNTIVVDRVIPKGEVFDKTLTVVVTDAKGNETTLTEQIKVDISTANTDYSVSGNLLVPNKMPQLNVGSPTAKDNGDTAYTKVTLTDKDGTEYTRIYSSANLEAQKSIFDFSSGKWYKTTNDGSVYTLVEPISMDAASLYGVTNVTIESSFEDLTPILDGALPNTDVNTGYNLINIGTVNYAPELNAYSIEDTGIYNKITADLVDQSEIHDATLEKFRVQFKIKNTVYEGFGTTDIDFANSFVILEGPEGLVIKQALSNSLNQRVVLPNYDYLTGEYNVSVNITQRSGVVNTFDLGKLFLDNTKIDITGIPQIEIKKISSASEGNLIKDPAGNSLNHLYMQIPKTTSVDQFYYVEESNEYVSIQSIDDTPVKHYYETSSNSYYDIFFGAKHTPTQLENGEVIGEIKDLYIWVDGHESDKYLLSTDGNKRSLKTIDGYLGYSIPLSVIFSANYSTRGFDKTQDNLVYYQFVLENGNLSPVNSILIEVANEDVVVSADVNYDVNEMVTVEGTPYIESVDVSLSRLKSLFGNNVSVTSHVYDEASDAFIESPYYGEAFTLTVDEHISNSVGTALNVDFEDTTGYYNEQILKLYFTAVDEFGNSATIIPQIGNEAHTSNRIKVSQYNFVPYKYTLNDFYGFSPDDINWTLKTGDKYDGSYTLAWEDHIPNADYGKQDLSPIDFEKSTIQMLLEDGTYGPEVDLILSNPLLNSNNGYISGEMIAETDPNTLLDGEFVLQFAYPIDKTKVGEVYADKAQVNFVSLTGAEKTIEVDLIHLYDESNQNYVYKDHILADKSQDSTDKDLALADKDNKIYFNTFAFIDWGELLNHYVLPTDMNAHFVDITANDAYGKEHVFDAKTTENVGAPTIKTIVNSVEKDTVSRAFTVEPITLVFEDDSKLTVTYIEENYDDYEETIIIDNNNSEKVKVTLNFNTKITVTDENGTSYTYTVNNFDLDKLKEQQEKVIVPSVEFTDEKGDKIIVGAQQEISGSVTAHLYYADSNGDVIEYLVDENDNKITHVFDPEATGFSYDYSIGAGEYFDSFGATGEDFAFNLRDDYNITLQIKDETSPSVQIKASASNDLQTVEIEKLYNYVPTNPESSHPSLPDIPTGYIQYTAIEDFINDLGYAPKFVLNYVIADKLDTDIYIKSGIIANVPTDKISDNIDGVVLNELNASITISQTAQFTIFVEDDNGNTSIIPIDITMTDAPVFTPIIEEVKSVNSDYVRVYVSEDHTAVERLRIVNLGTKVETAAGLHKDKAYIDLTTNGEHLIQYNYYMNGLPYSGYEVVDIDSVVGTSEFEIIKESWSSNHSYAITNKDVSVVYTFNKDIASINSTSAVETAVNNGELEFEAKDNKFTLIYNENFGEQNGEVPPKFELTATDGSTIIFESKIVGNISKVLPNISVTQTLSDTGRYVSLKFVSEDGTAVNFREAGTNGTEFTKNVYANGEYEFNFTDAGGNTNTLRVMVDSIVIGGLNLTFSMSQSGEYVENPNSFNINTNSTIWVKVNRDSTVTLNEQTKNVTANIATSFVMSDSGDGYAPTMLATDTYGNTDAHIFTNVVVLDVIAPKIIVRSSEVFARLSDSQSDIEETLKNNVIVIDNKNDEDVVLEYTFNKRTTSGLEIATYKATDLAGNVTTAEVKLWFVSDNEPQPTIDGDFVERGGVTSVQVGEHKLVVNMPENNGETEEYSIIFEKGIKTVAQLKIGSTVLKHNVSTNDEITLDFNSPGYYTVCIKTQGRDYYEFIVYVE